LGTLGGLVPGILYPLFDLTMWPLVSEPSIFTTVGRDAIEALTLKGVKT
jgi:hypothetical protein